MIFSRYHDCVKEITMPFCTQDSKYICYRYQRQMMLPFPRRFIGYTNIFHIYLILFDYKNHAIYRMQTSDSVNRSTFCVPFFFIYKYDEQNIFAILFTISVLSHSRLNKFENSVILRHSFSKKFTLGFKREKNHARETCTFRNVTMFGMIYILIYVVSRT